MHNLLYFAINVINAFRVGEITIIAEDLAIVEITRKGEFFGYFPIVNDRMSSAYSRNKEIAILIALSEKHEGLNGKFSQYAAKMLDISEPE